MSKLTAQIANIQTILNAPNLTSAQKISSSPSIGSVIYNVDDKVLEIYDGTQWLLLLGTRATTGVSGGGLYAFTNATFSSGGLSGRDGPTLSQAQAGLTGAGVDAWKNNTAYFTTSSGIQLWTIPKTGSYTIEVWGAQGGNGAGNNYLGGYGARMKGTFSLTQGETLKILVGQMGGTNYGGGGGMTAVATTSNIPLIVAGGGNTTSPWSGTVIHATTSTTGASSSAYGGGSGGAGGSSNAGAYGGAGFLSDAQGGDSCSATRPVSFVNGGRGGSSCNSIGGFGGGSATDGCCYGASGAGGGYSGGGGTSGSSQYGGAGGSYNSGSSPDNSNGNSSGAQRAGISSGQAIITFVS